MFIVGIGVVCIFIYALIDRVCECIEKRKDKVMNDVIARKYVAENYIHKDVIKEIRDKAECMDYYTLVDVINDLNKILEAKDENKNTINDKAQKE